MARRIGERVKLARDVRKSVAVYLSWIQASPHSGASEDRAHAALMAAMRDLEKLIGIQEGRQ